AAVLAAGAGAGPGDAPVAAGLAAPGPEPWDPAPQTGCRGGPRARGERRRGPVSATSAGGGGPVIQLLLGIGAHAAPLLFYRVLAAAALTFAAWAELEVTVEFVAEPGLLLIVQVCWLLAVLGPAVQPESLRPQVLGNVVVPGLLPVKIACAFLYLLCLPALLRLWPFTPPADKRVRQRLDAGRVLTWFPYCGLFTTLFVTPSTDDV